MTTTTTSTLPTPAPTTTTISSSTTKSAQDIWLSELSNDEKALAKRVLQIIEQVHNAHREIDSLHRRIAVASVEKTELDEKTEAIIQAKDTMMVLYNALQSRNEALREEAKEQAAEEKERREQLSDSFNASIAEITQRMEKDTQQRVLSLNQNEALKVELKDHEDHIQNFITTYEQQYTALETESRMLSLKNQFLHERFDKDNALLPDLEAKHAEAKEKDDVLRAEMTQYANRFEQLQKDISDSSQWFHKHQAEIERLTKRLKVLEGERLEAIKKAKKAETEYTATVSEKNEAAQQLRKSEEGAATMIQLANALHKEINELKLKEKILSSSSQAKSTTTTSTSAVAQEEVENINSDTNAATTIENDAQATIR